MKSISTQLLLALACLSLGACAKDPPPMTTTPSVTVLDASALPEPGADGELGTLGPLDLIKVDVFGVEQMSREIQVSTSGKISFPFVGTLDVSGRSQAEVAEMIEQGLRRGYIKDPVVTVNMMETNSQTIAVEGEVEKPGVYPAAGRLTLLRAMAMAGGSTDYALDEQIVVFRNVADARYAGVYNLEAVRRGLVDDPRIYANDTIVVGPSPRRKAIDQLITVAPAFTSPLILLLTRL